MASKTNESEDMEDIRQGNLCITRKAGESVMVGTAKITVQWLKQDRARLVINAPAEVKIVRTELLARGEQ